MSKIICDICGTSYPETVEQCPICGCVRPADVQNTIPDHENDESVSGYTYVKGGRFSKGNVKKRIKSFPASENHTPEDYSDNENSHSYARTGLIITAIALLLAIIAVVIYITIQFFNMMPSAHTQENQNNVVSTQQYGSCTGLTISDETVTLTQEGSAWLLNVQKTPSDTTDSLSCTSDDENIATAIITSSDKVKITAVGSGTTVIHVICGNQELACNVICDFDNNAGNNSENTQPTEKDGYSADDIVFNSRYNPPEATLRSEGETWNCYKGNIPANEITWKSDDESVATVENGIVTAVSKGKTLIHAIWGEYDLTCTVRCNFITSETGIPGSDDVEIG